MMQTRLTNLQSLAQRAAGQNNLIDVNKRIVAAGFTGVYMDVIFNEDGVSDKPLRFETLQRLHDDYPNLEFTNDETDEGLSDPEDGYQYVYQAQINPFNLVQIIGFHGTYHDCHYDSDGISDRYIGPIGFEALRNDYPLAQIKNVA